MCYGHTAVSSRSKSRLQQIAKSRTDFVVPLLLIDMKDIFFYGLFMDESVLRANGVEPRVPRKAVVRDYQLRIGQRARLCRQPSSQAFGMVYALTDSEIDSLYSEAGLEMYHPEFVVATYEDGSSSEVTTFNLSDETGTEEPNPEYVAKLRLVLERLGFPASI